MSMILIILATCNIHNHDLYILCKMFPSKTRADVGMVQCVPARYGKTTWQNNRRNKEERRSMQRGGAVGPCNKEEGRSMQNPGH